MATSIWKALPLNEYLALTGEGKDEHELEETATDEDGYILQYLTDRNQDKGRKILTALREGEDLKWDRNGDVIFKGIKIPNAHMAGLLSLSLRTLPIKTPKIAGLDEFLHTIKILNLPRSLFTSSFLKLLDGKKNEKSQRSGFELKKFRDTYLLK